MSLGKTVRLNRIFSHPSGRLCSVAVDHVSVYGEGLPPGLRQIKDTLGQIVEGHPDAVTMHKGIAASCWMPYAGRVPLILQSTFSRPTDPYFEQMATPEDAIRLGADAIAVVAFLRGAEEAARLGNIADVVRAAERLELPVIAHVYPRKMDGIPTVSFEPEDIAWAVRCAVEAGVDVVKAPYCGSVAAQAQIVADCPVPLVAAGGPRSGSLIDALKMMTEVIRSGARGATIGRNIWGFPQICGAVRAFRAVIHDGMDVTEAMQVAGLS